MGLMLLWVLVIALWVLVIVWWVGGLGVRMVLQVKGLFGWVLRGRLLSFRCIFGALGLISFIIIS